MRWKCKHNHYGSNTQNNRPESASNELAATIQVCGMIAAKHCSTLDVIMHGFYVFDKYLFALELVSGIGNLRKSLGMTIQHVDTFN